MPDWKKGIAASILPGQGARNTALDFQDPVDGLQCAMFEDMYTSDRIAEYPEYAQSRRIDNSGPRAAEFILHNSRHENDIVLAGLPRSGSTLTCHLINKLPDAVALNEPMSTRRFKDLPDNGAICDAISRFLVSMRGSLEKSGTAMSKHIDGVVPDNPVAGEISSDGLRKGEAILGEIDFAKDLPVNFTLVVKHPSAFAALLPDLAKRFSTFATIRNPVAVLSSWNSVSMPVRDGRAPKGEKMDPELQARLESIPERLDRQVIFCRGFSSGSDRCRRTVSSAMKISSRAPVALFALSPVQPLICANLWNAATGAICMTRS